MSFVPGLGLRCQTQSDITYAREGNLKQARVELAAVLEERRSSNGTAAEVLSIRTWR